MARPATSSPEQIIEAGKRLRDTGRPVTPFAIKVALGGGNNARIDKIWTDFVEKEKAAGPQPEVDAEVPPAALPPEYAEAMNQAVQASGQAVQQAFFTAFRLADRLHTQRYAAEFRALRDSKAQTEQQIVDAKQAAALDEARIAELETTQEVTEKERDDLRTANAGLEERVRNLLAERDEARRERDAAREDLRIRTSALNDLQADFSKQSGQMQALIEGAKQLRDDKVKVEQERDGFRDDLVQARTKQADAERERNEAKDNAKQAREAAERAAQDLATASGVIETLRQQIATMAEKPAQ